jgi:hypothetical protein
VVPATGYRGIDMTGFDKLEEFHFDLHGDGREREWWHLVSSDFPAHEEFWRKYIVPLTNRVNPNINPQNSYSHWIGARQDINRNYEQMAMHHYSVFYFLARATYALRVDKSFYPEDILYLLDSCGDNVHNFFVLIKQIAKKLGGSLEFLPNQEKDLCPEESRIKKMCERGGFVEVKKYRNALLPE